MEATAISRVPPLYTEDLQHIFTNTREIWEELRGANIFITGGTGFFGFWLLESFAYANERLGLRAHAYVLTRQPEAFVTRAPHLSSLDGIRWVRGDVRNFKFPDAAFSHVIHAGTTSSGPVEPQEMFATIVDGTRRVLEFSADHGVRKLLFVSSGAVYGRQPSNLTHIPEDYLGGPDPLDAASAYGEGKRAAELSSLLASKKHGFEIKIARCFAFVGPHLPLDAHFAIGNFIRDAMRGGPILIMGDGTPYRSYLYAADLAIWLWTILVRGISGRPYNVGSSDPCTILQAAEATKTAIGLTTHVQLAKQPVPGQPPLRYVPSTDRAETDLGLRRHLELIESIRRTISWNRSFNPA